MRIRTVTAAILALLSLFTLGCAGLLPSEPETDVPPEDPLPLPDGIERLEQVLEPIRAAHGVPALGAAIVEGDALVAIGAVGLRAEGSDRAVTVHDRWHVGSITKSMTATLLAHRVARGEIALEDPVANLLPGIDAHPRWGEITLGDVLRQRTGIADIGVREILAWHSTTRPPDEVRREWLEGALAKEPAPDAGFAYANANYLLAGAILEAHAGRAWDALIFDELFAPLAMTRSGLRAPPGWHQPWGHRDGLLGRAAIAPGPAADNPAAMGPAGTAHASLHDLARYAAAHLAMERGEPPYEAPVYRWLHTPPDGGTYAGGWVVEEKEGRRVMWHNGSNTMWYAVVSLEPHRDRALIVTANLFHQDSVHEALKTLRARP